VDLAGDGCNSDGCAYEMRGQTSGIFIVEIVGHEYKGEYEEYREKDLEDFAVAEKVFGFGFGCAI